MNRAFHSREINKERPTICLGTNLLNPFLSLFQFTCHCWCETKDLTYTMVWRTNTIGAHTYFSLQIGMKMGGKSPKPCEFSDFVLFHPLCPIKPIVGVEGKKLGPEPTAWGEGEDFVTFTTGGTEAQEAGVLRLGELFPKTVSQSREVRPGQKKQWAWVWGQVVPGQLLSART